MFSWFQIAFAGIWPLIWTFGTGGLICAGLVAAYFFMPVGIGKIFPNLQKWLLPAAGVVAYGLISYGLGVGHEHNRNVAQEIIATNNAYADARKAATDAPLQVAKRNGTASRKRSVWVSAPRRDGYDLGKKR